MQVGDAEVVHRVAVVVLERDHGRRRLDPEVECEERLRVACERLQPNLVEALEDGILVRVARAMDDPVPHARTSCTVNGRCAKNSSSMQSLMR